MVATAHERPLPDSGWVPVEQRWLGLDKRSLRPALIVAAIGILLGGVLPLVNNAVAWDNEIQAGEVIDLGNGLTVAPPRGWQLEGGTRIGEPKTNPVSAGGSSALLVSGAVSVFIRTAPFTGDNTALLNQVDNNREKTPKTSGLTVRGPAETLTTADGRQGLVQHYTGIDSDAVVAVFTFPAGGSTAGEIGLTVEADTTGGQLAPLRDELDAMLRSINWADRS
ncbi:hypothetical protein [Antrihabitans sp. YC2-6]|uniref:hypothetical protein n=1 Tax=Antrihabitans sp. YC2-6 TaxID=2799498 RepID=UPI0018F4BDCC|nr:hypothetical protein [Antrihabitans sp. YC2-6]MBJ8344718.1 hypothetical protein [Antrihabitans sp. YC2-6]